MERFVRGVACLAGAVVVVLGGCVGDPPGAGRAPVARAVLADEAFLEQYAATYRFGAGRPRAISLTPGGGAVLFLRSGPRSVRQDLYEFDVATGRERVLVTAEQVLGGGEEHLTPEELARRERMRMTSRGIASYALSEDGTKILVPLSGRLFVVDRATAKVRELPSDAGYPIDPRFSRDAAKVACVRNGDVYVIDAGSGEERRLTTDAVDGVTNGLAEFVAQEEMSRFQGYWWSPDGEMIAYEQADTGGLETFHIADPVNPDREPQTWPYPRPGKANAAVKLGIVPAGGGATTWVQWDREAYPYLATVTWEENSPLTILVQNREQTDEELLAVDPATGSATVLLHEHDDAWINLDQSSPRWFEDGSGFLWTTERNGDWQVELRARDGSLVRAVTPVDLGMQGLAGLDEKRGLVYVAASGDPTQTHIWRVPLDPARGRPERLTSEPGVHGIVLAKEFGASVVSSSTLGGDLTWSVRRADMSEAGRLSSVAEAPPFMPRPELVTVGERQLRAAIVRPRNFDASRRYPVMVSVYGGPGSQTVRATAYGYLLQQWYADHGFVVVSIDGRGTPGRGRDWERVTKDNFIDLPLEDQTDGVAALGRRYREMDLSRVGIQGWSFGGYFSAMAAMRRPDVFHLGVAGAPVADFADYDTHYTERYLGLPERNPEGYKACNVLTYCDRLTRPLLIIHGTADDNVYFMHSLKMTEALFRAGKDFEFLPLAGFTHMVPEPVVTKRLYSRLAGFFVEHLHPERE